ncbi:MAG: SseB family protein [Clostridiales bacterium]|nr:SseB family protein [Clostridiales bacterium]
MDTQNISPVKNPALKDAIVKAKENSGMENSVKFLNEVVRARLLAPVSMDKDPEYDKETGEVILEKDTAISFELISADNGDLYYPVFTDGEEMLKCEVDENQRSLIINFDDLAAMLLQPQNSVAGFVINPMSDNVVFGAEMVAAMKKDMEKEVSKDGPEEDLEDFEYEEGEGAEPECKEEDKKEDKEEN